ncbi:MAG: replication-associated recombination protein A [Chlorobium sp.]|uniref:replication-associated recombination protein A n=1 Tax=Chlorobium sp. TaxID=1095 RepID=UPI0025BF7BC7|nr:replication-associated recombination protein A [Chlorobium sp.]MCF8216419.1 replication-associated recombination protein A [Chlorobium sp.]MCF8271322.1 replication-associated recombination protein A [Chlorobium sp.]MCF8287696.1 replication-associated recombination protein A [Chlorobium sp.]MCF8291235.1 replication-associated recombination protein A [Chlorobium sp.]MCF8385343.1 replication-associated recombination protein A [Chlorobium sp.]
MTASDLFQSDLFGLHEGSSDPLEGGFQPLAERVRPRTLDDLAGQEHLAGPDGPLRSFLESGRLPSMIFWGPPGSGKTTLAEICARSMHYRFEQLSAIDAGVREVRKALDGARQAQRTGDRTILFIDEIHRFNKTQQDTLLHAIEQGLVILIGATTENPSFEVNAALLSRMQVYILKPLSETDIEAVIRRALERDGLLQEKQVAIAGLDFLLQFAGGDARKALNALEAALALVPPEQREVVLDRSLLERALQHRAPHYDKGAAAHYDTISAFIKSMRGSDPDASLFWLARMLEGGEDPLFIARRMVIFASEDVGNADPFALTLAVSVFQAVQMIGLPEGRINLAQGVTYLASAPKSNASYEGVNEAMRAVKQFQDAGVPLHLRNASTSLMKDIGYGAGYRYPHGFPGHFVEEHYFPDGVLPQLFYRPTEEGREKFAAERLRGLWKDRYRP